MSRTTVTPLLSNKFTLLNFISPTMKEAIVVMRQTKEETSQIQDPKAERKTSDSLVESLSPYNPLSQDRDCTRLLRIETGEDDDPITCTLSEVAFSDRPKFDALSYMWGYGKADQKITLNGNDFNVRQNLWDALHYLRKAEPNTSYWIDAICINQQDIAERSRQVRMMHHIYFRAQTVVVWLGKWYVAYEATLPDLKRLVHGQLYNGQMTLESSEHPPRSDLPERQFAKTLYNDDYWKRLWIVQEIALAQKIKVCFGNSAMEWKHFTHFITMHNLGSKGPIRLERQREEKYSGSNTLLQLLHDHQEADCQDRKDKVYGLVGMASDARGFAIDYEKSLFEIWADVMEFMNKNRIFYSEDVISVGNLVKFLLMGVKCDPLQQILRSYAPKAGDDTIITDTNDPKAFKLRGAALGCVIHVGPQAKTMIGKLDVVDGWIQQVQANYRNDLESAHRESDKVIRAILDLDDDSLSKKCYDCRSVIQWWQGHSRFLGGMSSFSTEWIQRLQSETQDFSQIDSSLAAESSDDTSRLFQMSTQHRVAPWKLGLSSNDIRVGDIICWLGWPRRGVVVRAYDEGRRWKLQVVGTAVVAADLTEQQLGGSQRPDWSEGKPRLSIFLDARTIFVLLAD